MMEKNKKTTEKQIKNGSKYVPIDNQWTKCFNQKT